jgi:uncharacterized membrane protein
MFPGITTKLSQDTVASTTTVEVKADLLHVTGTTNIATLNPHFGGGFSGVVFIVPTDGTVNTVTTGNISVAVAMAQNRVTVLVWSKKNSTWYPGAIS